MTLGGGQDGNIEQSGVIPAAGAMKGDGEKDENTDTGEDK